MITPLLKFKSVQTQADLQQDADSTSKSETLMTDRTFKSTFQTNDFVESFFKAQTQQELELLAQNCKQNSFLKQKLTYKLHKLQQELTETKKPNIFKNQTRQGMTTMRESRKKQLQRLKQVYMRNIQIFFGKL